MRLSVCPRSHGRNFDSILTKLRTDLRSLKQKDEFVAVKVEEPFIGF